MPTKASSTVRLFSWSGRFSWSGLSTWSGLIAGAALLLLLPTACEPPVVEGDDVTPPTFMLVAPANMATTDSTPDIVISFMDGAMGSGVDEATLMVSLDGADISGNCTIAGGQATCTTTTALTAGMHTVDVSASDEAGNEGTAQFMFNVVLPVAVTLNAPANNTFTTGDAIEVSGDVGAGANAVTVNNTSVALTGTSFSTNVSLREGVNTITVVATGPSGEAGTNSVRVTRDTTPPSVVIDGPADGSTTGADMVTVTGTVADVVIGPVNNANCTVRIRGRDGFFDADIENGTFVAENIPVYSGENRISAIATDALGNQGAPFTITVNRQVAAGQRLVVMSGANQMGTAGAALLGPVVIKASDANGVGLPGRRITFSVAKNDGKLGPAETTKQTVITDADGEAEIDWTLGKRAGRANNRLQVSAPGFAPMIICASAQSADCSMLVPDGGEGQRGVAGQPLPQPFVVAALDAQGNRCANQPVTFTVESGGGAFGDMNSIEVMTGPGGFAMATLTLGTIPGINNQVVRVTTPGDATGVTFRATALAPDMQVSRTFSGTVLNTDNEPIAGAMVYIRGDMDGATTTDDMGSFELADPPLGNQFLVVDATIVGNEGAVGQIPLGEITYPAIEFVVDVSPNVANTLARPIFLPTLDPLSRGSVGASTTTLRMAGVDGLELTIFPNSATFPSGFTVGEMSVTQVSNDQVPMPPNGGAAPPWVGTLQPAGVHFDPPVQVSTPNSLGLDPGSIVDMFSFNHELGMFINIGTGTVQPDGARIVSDPGSGIRVSGWFFDCPPPPPPVEIKNDDDVQNNKDIQREFQDALSDSNQGVLPVGPAPNEHEEGGWIIQDSEGNIRADRAPPGDGDSLTNVAPNLNPGDAVIAHYHTHPENPAFQTSPSGTDVMNTPNFPTTFGFDGSEYLGGYVISCNEIWVVDNMGNVRKVSNSGPNPGD